MNKIDHAEKLLQLTEEGTSPFHVTASVERQLQEAGFKKVQLGKNWKLEKGGRYYLVHHGTSLVAFAIGKCYRTGDAFRMAAAHTDFPGLRIKPSPEVKKAGYRQLNVEIYGGAILNTWLDRPLSASGRVALRSDDVFHPQMRLVDFKKPFLTIPNLAIHMNREVNKGVPYKANVDMLPICRTVQGEFEKNGYLVRQLAKRLQVQPEDVLSFELCAYCCAEPTLLGFEKDLLSSPRLDNLSSVHACLQGLVDAQGDGINVAVLYDNEEIGSNTRRGADSSTLTVILEKLALSLGLDRTALLDACLNGMLLSCDAAHAMHPNHPEYADFSCAPVLGGGVALKRSPRYSSDAETCAVIQGRRQPDPPANLHEPSRPARRQHGRLYGLVPAGHACC